MRAPIGSGDAAMIHCMRLLALAVAAVVAACTWTPQAPADRDAQAKQFEALPHAATIYVYRSPHDRYSIDTILYLDGQVIGHTLPGRYYRLDTTPGRHVLHGSGVDAGEIALETRAGQIYFVALDVAGGYSQFQAVPEAQGRERVAVCCTLLESWSPGLRPFLLR